MPAHRAEMWRDSGSICRGGFGPHLTDAARKRSADALLGRPPQLLCEASGLGVNGAPGK